MKLHLVNDEKIINRTIDEFEQIYPGQNLWVVTNRTRDFKIIDKRDNVIGRCEFIKNHSREKYDSIFIHLLNKRKINVLKHVDTSNAKVYWIIWGLDLYNKLLVPKGFRLYAPGNSGSRTKGISAIVKRIGEWIQSKKTIRFIRKKVDYIVTDTTENDYTILTEFYPKLKDKVWKDFFYYPIDVILNDELMKSETSGNDIMIGNSASATNNHEYVIDALARFDTGNRRIVAPLSYSGRGNYASVVAAKGKEKWGDRFIPLMTFLPLAEYNKQQLSTSVALFGNLRQEAIGNILIFLYLGAKVFLPQSNPVYDWALSHGLTVKPLENLSQEELDQRLPETDRIKNREILKSLYTRQRMHELMRNL